MSGKLSHSALARRTFISVILIVIAVISELVISNYRNFFKSENGGISDLDAFDLQGGEESGDARLIFPNETKNINLGKISGKVRAIRLCIETAADADGEKYFSVPLKVTVLGYDGKRPRTLSTLSVDYVTPGVGAPHENIIYLDTDLSGYGDLTISLSDGDGLGRITELTLNPSDMGFRFNFWRFLILCLIFLSVLAIHECRLGSEDFDKNKISHLTAILATFILCLGMTVLFCVMISGDVSIKYPFEYPVESYDPYAQQTDAFLKGRLDIDYPVSDKLLALENPYDADSRNDVPYIWDRAMYNGKYYSYYGPAPILNFYLPFKLITGNLPTVESAKMFYLLMSVVFVCAFLPAYVILCKKKVRVTLLCVGTVSLVFSSAIFLISRGVPTFYYLAMLAGYAYLAAFLFFLLLSIKCVGRIKRRVFFVLAGYSYSMLFMSRLNMALLAAFAVLPVIWFEIIRSDRNRYTDNDGKKRVNFKSMAYDLISLGVPVLITAVFTMWFNNARFGDPFEFGAKYQLTVSDVGQNGLSLSMIPGAVYHYFLQPLEINSKFPFFTLQYHNLFNYETYVYVDPCFGLFSIPLMSGLILAPGHMFCRKKSALSRWLCGCCVFGMFAVALMNFCLGGVIFRYTADITLMAAVISTLLIFDLNESVSLSDGGAAVRVSSYGLMLLSVFVTLSLSLCVHSHLCGYDVRIFAFFSELFKV